MIDQGDKMQKSIDFYKYLDVELEKVKTSDDLVEYVEALLAGYKDGLLEEQPLEEYLSGISGATLGIEGLCMNYGYDKPGPTDWKWVARILTVAFGHS